MDRLIEILEELKPGVDFKRETALIEDSVLDSFDMVMLVGELNDAFDIEIGVEEFIPENFNTVTDIMNLIIRLRDEN